MVPSVAAAIASLTAKKRFISLTPHLSCQFSLGDIPSVVIGLGEPIGLFAQLTNKPLQVGFRTRNAFGTFRTCASREAYARSRADDLAGNMAVMAQLLAEDPIQLGRRHTSFRYFQLNPICAPDIAVGLGPATGNC